MEEGAQAEENRAVAGDGASIHHWFAVLHAGPPARRLGYLFVAMAVMAICAALVYAPDAALFAYAVLLLGVTSIWRAVLLPPRRIQAHEGRVVDDAGNHRQIASSGAAMAWRGYLLVAAPVMWSCWRGLPDTPDAALFDCALLLLGVTSIWRAILPPQPMEAHEGRAVVNDAGEHYEVAYPGAAMVWRGYVLVAVPVMGSCYGLADTPGAALLAYALLLLGLAFVGHAMLC